MRRWPTSNPQPFASRGHGAARYTIDVRVDEIARPVYQALLPGTVFADGTVIAAFHHDPEHGRTGPIYVMEKVEGRWRYSIVGSDGRQRQQSSLELCARCHAEAVSDHVFGLPEKVRAAADGGP